MKNSLLALSATLVLPFAVACGGSSKNNNTVKNDLSVKSGDMATSGGGGDMAAGGSCTQVATWPTTLQFATSKAPYINIGDQEPNAADSSTSDLLVYEYYGMNNVTVPHAYTASSDDTYGKCVDCVTILVGVSQQAQGDLYFATSGSVNLTKADYTATGTVAATGANLHLVHWDYDSDAGTDEADADGKCYDVASFNFTANYDNSVPDGASN